MVAGTAASRHDVRHGRRATERLMMMMGGRGAALIVVGGIVSVGRGGGEEAVTACDAMSCQH